MFTCTPLLGASSTSSASQTILEFENGIKILIDVGWGAPFDSQQLAHLEHEIPSISLILLTHATVDHLGAYAHCCKHFPQFSRIPVYATTPVISFGRTLLQALYATDPLAASQIALPLPSTAKLTAQDARTLSSILLEPPTSAEIGRYFALINPVKYSQPHLPIGSPLAPAPDGLTITAYNAGHSLGGSIWHLQCGLESVIYASDWNQGKENVLSGAAWLSATAAGGAEVVEQLHNPTALLCSVRSADDRSGLVSRSQRDRTLLAMVKPVLAQGGIAAVVVETGSRLLEIVHVLDQAWRRANENKGGSDILKTAELVLVNKKGGNILREAEDMVEWMNDSMIKEFETGAVNQEGDGNTSGPLKPGPRPSGPLQFRHVRVVKSSLAEFLRRTEAGSRSPGGKLVLTDPGSFKLEAEEDSMQKFIQDPRNLVLLTSNHSRRSTIPNGNTSQSLLAVFSSWYSEWKSSTGSASEDCYQPNEQAGRQARFVSTSTQGLNASEQDIYRRYNMLQTKLNAVIQPESEAALLANAELVEGEESSDESSDDDSDSGGQGKLLNLAATSGKVNRAKAILTEEELGVNILLKKADNFDWDTDGRKGKDRLFPGITRRKRFDEYGDLIKPEDYLRADEREELVSDQVGGTGNPAIPPAFPKASSKRKWDGDDEGGLRVKRPLRESDMRSKTRETYLQESDVINGSSDGLGIASSEDEGLNAVEPCKTVRSERSVMVRLRVGYIDLSGLRDMQSYRILLPLIAPRKLILLGGDLDQTRSLAQDSRLIMNNSQRNGHGDISDPVSKVFEVLTPHEGETVDASVDTEAWEGTISQELYSQLTWQKVKNLKVVYLVAQVTKEDPIDGDENLPTPMQSPLGTLKMEIKAEDSDEGEGALAATTIHRFTDKAEQRRRPRLIPLTDNETDETSAPSSQLTNQTLHIGDIRLPELRKVFHSAGHAADFRGEGVMVIDQSVTLRKTAAGRLEIEGGGLLDTAAISRAAQLGGAAAAGSAMAPQLGAQASFVEVRERIYQGLAIITSA